MSGANRQIRLQPLTARLQEWIFLSFHDMNHVLLTVGQTDPRENARGEELPIPETLDPSELLAASQRLTL
ncbi:MAG: hypothetical protein WAV05_15340 [Anaerolineales bacterium]